MFPILRDRLDSLLHPSARSDALIAARHRAFIAPRLIGSLVALTAFPAYLVLRGAPGALEVVAFAWLIIPIVASYYLSRTGRYEIASVLSSLALAAMVTLIAAATGGIESFAAIWLVLLPFEAALSANRRLVTLATALALVCVGFLITAGEFGWFAGSVINQRSGHLAAAFGAIVATLYAAGLAFGAQALGKTSVSLLSLEEDRYLLLARNMSDVISRHRANGAVVFISPAAEALLGAPSARLIGQGLFDRVHVGDRPAYLTALSDAARGGEERSVEFRLRSDARAPQSFVWVEMRCRPLTGHAGNMSGAEVVAVMRDITDRKMQEEALSQARADAERAGAAKDRFLATMSHELRTPLNAIIGFSEMIVHEEAMMVDAARRKEYAQLINDSGQHLLSVVNGILDVSKMEAGNFEIAPEPFSPRAALMNCCDILALKARDSGVDLVAQANTDLPEISGDPRAFKQILLNLVSNAIKFTESGGTVSVKADIEGDRLMLRVNDTGIGIAEGDLGRLGDPFFQAGKTYQRKHEGTGLGLSIVKSLVALHDGELTIASQLGEGTMITVSLPLNIVARRTDNVATLNTAPRSAKQTIQAKKIA